MGCDNIAQRLDLGSGQPVKMAQHEAPIKCCRFIEEKGGLLVTAGWDKMLKVSLQSLHSELKSQYWDARQQDPVFSFDLGEKAYCMDAVKNLMVCSLRLCALTLGCRDGESKSQNLQPDRYPIRLVQCQLQKYQAMLSSPQDIESPLKWQTKSVVCFPSADSYALGSIEGRVAIQ